ncbi:hypothetical protein Tco_1482081 [Tanacetum coccineum]
MQQPMPNPEDITYPTTAINMAFVLMAKALKLNYSTPTNNNLRISSNPRNRQIAQPGMNIGQDRQMQTVGGNGGNQFRQYVGQNVGNQNGYNAVQNVGNQNPMEMTQLLIAQKEDAGIQLQAEEFDLMAAAADLDEIEEVNANYNLMTNLQKASTSGTQTDKAPVYDSYGLAEHDPPVVYDSEETLELAQEKAAKFFRDFKSLAIEADESLAKHKALELEIERLLRAIISQDILSIVKSNSVIDTSNLQTELDHTKEQFENYIIRKENEYAKLWNDWYKKVDNTAKTKRPQPRSNTKNDRVLFASKSSCSKNKEVEVEEHPRNLLLSKNKKHMSSECNNIKLAIQNDKSEVVCAMCKQCLITANHDVCVLNYVNDMNSHGKKQKANVSNTENQKKQKPKVMKPKKVGSNERLASPKPSKPRSCLRWSPTGRLFDLKGKIIASSESESQSDCSNGDNACTSNPLEHTIKRFPNSTYFLGRKPDISFLHVFGALCYPKNDREELGSLVQKVILAFSLVILLIPVLIEFTTKGKKIIETMNVTFDELSAMAFEQSSSKPGLQSMTFGQISSGLDLTYASSTITTQQPTEGELDLLFEAMYDDYIGGHLLATPRTTLVAQVPQALQTPTATTTTTDTAPTPTNASSQATNFPNTS